MEFLREGLLWLDAPVHYGTVAWAAFAATTGLACLPPGSRRDSTWRESLLFSVAVMATLAAFRWPAWFTAGEFNPDESQMIAGAITLREHLLPWKYLDAGSHGPVSECLLVFASWLGAPLNQVTARFMATALQAFSLIATWWTLRTLTSERVARFSVLPGLAFWSFITWVDYLHYGSELPGIALISLAAWAVVKPLVSPPGGWTSSLRLFLGGFALGLVPLTKLQQVPLGASLALLFAILLGVKSRRSQQPFFGTALLWFLAGGLSVFLLVAGYLWVFGLGDQFWHAYIVSALDYSADGHHPLREMASWFFHFSATAFGFAWFFWGGLSFSLLFTRSPAPPAVRLARNLGWGALGIAMYCVLRPSREVAHYLHILVIPATMLCGLVLAGAVAEPPQSRWARLWPYVAFGLLTLLPQVHFRAISGNGYVGSLPANLSQPRSAAGEYIHERQKAGDSLAMWGWEPRLYVETGLGQGTRESATSYLLSNWPLKDFYIDRYKGDLLRRKPAWFVDAVGPGAFVYENRSAFGHETIAPIREIIARDYEFMADIDSKRIYRLKYKPAPVAP
jgi:hypothetical protein